MTNDLKPIFELVGAKEEHFFHAYSQAHALTQVLFAAYLDVTRKTGKNHFITSTIEPSFVQEGVKRMETLGCIATTVSPESHGKITQEKVIEAITPRTTLVTLSWANELTGVIHDVVEIAEVCKERGILLHVDATTVMGKGCFKIPQCQADFFSFDGKALGCSLGALFSKVPFSPLMIGDVAPENQLKELLIASLKAKGELGIEMALKRDQFEKELTLPLYFKEEIRTPHISCVDFPGVATEALRYLLQKRGISSKDPNGALLHSGIKSYSALSFDWSDQEEIQTILECYHHLKKTSSFIV